jgi:pimeloyl-ACP methyl ester carboxylesterase
MDKPRDIVVLLHGIGRTGRSMRPLANALRQAGYDALALDYPWRHDRIDGLARWVDARLTDGHVWTRFARVHFVTHSMGGLVARCLVAQRPHQTNIGRMVMLGPPNGGSEVADALHRLPPYDWLYGPAGQELTTRANAAAHAAKLDLGVIAGSRGWSYPLGLAFIRGPHDGRVSVARTRLAGMTDHIVLPVTHSFMPANRRVQQQVLHFLVHGRFDR